MDTSSAYQIIKIYKAKQKRAFTSQYGLYQFIGMSFRIESAPATFQSVVNVVLSSVNGHYHAVYLYDIASFSQKESNHVEHTISVLRLLNNAAVTLKLVKLAFLIIQKNT